MARAGTLTLLGLVLGLGAACGSDEDDPDAAESTAAGAAPSDPTSRPSVDTTTTVPLSDTDLPTMTGQPQQPPKQPTDAFQAFTTRGRVEAGAVAGCVELVTEGGRYVLLGQLAADLVPGDEVEVRAIAAPQIRTVCNGSPIQVTEVLPG